MVSRGLAVSRQVCHERYEIDMIVITLKTLLHHSSKALKHVRLLGYKRGLSFYLLSGVKKV